VVTYVIRRLITAVLLLLLITAVVFAIFFLVPRLAGATPDSLATRYVGRAAGPQQIHEVAVRLGLTDPIYVQYGRFVKGLVAGTTYFTGTEDVSCPAPCLGYSFITQNPVLPDILDRLPVTISLALGAAILWLVGGVSAGVISALRRGSIIDRGVMAIALAGVSLPIFFTGLLSLSIFSYGLGWFPGGGTYVPFQVNPAEWAYHLILPWVTLAFLYAATYARLTRAGMLETMHEDYVRTARAKGLTEHRVLLRHALRTSLIAFVSLFGLDFGALVGGGALLTEVVFGLHGVGWLTYQSLANLDLPVIMATVMYAAFFVVVANAAVDFVYALLDPRVRRA
jgi:peptide/nickel transport system permease protein